MVIKKALSTTELRSNQRRLETYRLLAACYLRPDENLVEYEAALHEIWGGWNDESPSSAEEFLSPKAQGALELDYARLFVGPFELLAPPYGSIYLDNTRRLMGDSTAEVLKRYEEFEINLSGSFQDAPDHISAELEFMAYLIFRQDEALEAGDMAGAEGFLNAQKAFLKDHLASWAPEFARRVETCAESGFYRRLARVTLAFLQNEIQLLQQSTEADPQSG